MKRKRSHIVGGMSLISVHQKSSSCRGQGGENYFWAIHLPNVNISLLHLPNVNIFIYPLQMFALSRRIYQTSQLKNFILGSNTTCWCSIALMPSWCISQRQSNQMRGRAPSGNVGSTNWEISERISMLCLNFDNQNISRLNPSYPLDQFTSWKYRIYVSPLIHWTENLQLDSNHFYI